MATPSAPSCEIRRVIVHFYPDGLKGGAHPCEQRFVPRQAPWPIGVNQVGRLGELIAPRLSPATTGGR
jgi:hypothetical protein